MGRPRWPAWLLACAVPSCSKPKEGEPPYLRDAYLLGVRSYKAGVPADSNPHIGTSGAESVRWLEGWLDARETEDSRP